MKIAHSAEKSKGIILIIKNQLDGSFSSYSASDKFFESIYGVVMRDFCAYPKDKR